jgi:hypothetical protein
MALLAGKPNYESTIPSPHTPLPFLVSFNLSQSQIFTREFHGGNLKFVVVGEMRGL